MLQQTLTEKKILLTKISLISDFSFLTLQTKKEVMSPACVITQEVHYRLRRALPDIKGSEINKKGHTWENHMNI